MIKRTPFLDFVDLSEDSVYTRGNRYKLVQHHLLLLGYSISITYDWAWAGFKYRPK